MEILPLACQSEKIMIMKTCREQSVQSDNLSPWAMAIWTSRSTSWSVSSQCPDLHTCLTRRLRTGRPSSAEQSQPLVSSRWNPRDINVSSAASGSCTMSNAVGGGTSSTHRVHPPRGGRPLQHTGFTHPGGDLFNTRGSPTQPLWVQAEAVSF